MNRTVALILALLIPTAASADEDMGIRGVARTYIPANCQHLLPDPDLPMFGERDEESTPEQIDVVCEVFMPQELMHLVPIQSLPTFPSDEDLPPRTHPDHAGCFLPYYIRDMEAFRRAQDEDAPTVPEPMGRWVEELPSGVFLPLGLEGTPTPPSQAATGRRTAGWRC